MRTKEKTPFQRGGDRYKYNIVKDTPRKEDRSQGAQRGEKPGGTKTNKHRPLSKLIDCARAAMSKSPSEP
jgi:hypothetical protein